MRQSGAETLVTEEPYEFIAHVRICGGAGWGTTGSTRKTYGRDRFWHGRHRRTDNGWASSALAGLDITDHCASCLSAEQTPPADKPTDAAATRIEVSLDHWARVVAEQPLRPLR